MSRSKRNATHKINHSVKQRFQYNEPLLVIYNLTNKQDIKTAVETLMLNNELANSSSIFVVVPASDDEDDESLSGGFNSTIGLQLSDNYTQWLKNCNSDSDMRLRRPTPYHLKPSKRESTMYKLVLNAMDQHNAPPPRYKINKLCQITTPYKVTNKLCQMTTPCDVTNKLCQVTTSDEDVERTHHMKIHDDGRQRNNRDMRVSKNIIDKQIYNKPCQAHIPADVIFQQTYVTGTDTTIDRPCCCELQNMEDFTFQKQCCCVDTYFTESIQNCAKRIVPTESHLISPVLIKTDFSTEDFNLSNQNSFLQPSNIPFSSISAGLISPDTEDFDDDPIFEIDRRCIYNTPVPEFEENQKLTIQSCQCTPEKLRRLLEQVLAEKSLNKMSVCCGSSMDMAKVPKRTRFLDIKCSACFQTKHQTEDNICGSPPSFDCNCDKLSDITGQPLQNTAASTLFCLDDPVNMSIQGTTSSRHTKLTRTPRQIKGEEESVVKDRGTYTDAGKHRQYSNVADIDADYKHVGTDVAVTQNSSDYLSSNPLDQYENISIDSKNRDQIKFNLIRTMSGFKYPLNQVFPRPTLDAGTNILRRPMKAQHPSLRPIPRYDNLSMCSKTNDQIKSNLIRTLSGFKYPQTQPMYPQKPKPKVTFEEFLKYCANMNAISARQLSHSSTKPIENLNEKQRRIKTTPFLLHESSKKPRDPKVKEDMVQGLKLSMSGKASDSRRYSNFKSTLIK
ncbi:unnamed protein product [Arctia plantaginis]|uniref:Uncharacterized protein n=1 Tax=Arctia plantaginis TaxID=874455 RepID=A0A8S0Z7H6_ARCPL|nr:unnamed protein product [Arctia plantaginis]